jgi:DNA-directed RNA polymerase subunit N (RpoN/RPB10)
MIIPIKCFTCGFVLADKYRYYIQEVQKKKNCSKNLESNNIDKII